ncbi:hypothetical protein [Embleya sp. NPDC050493]|uniref:hypothetical protein n=1 Tax=Embleya sp. NPDC050493 TaxID=3363989 RepID=UPI0037BBE20A
MGLAPSSSRTRLLRVVVAGIVCWMRAVGQVDERVGRRVARARSGDRPPTGSSRATPPRPEASESRRSTPEFGGGSIPDRPVERAAPDATLGGMPP